MEGHIQEKLKPCERELTLLGEIPGADGALAAVIIAELGVDIGVFPKTFDSSLSAVTKFS